MFTNECLGELKYEATTAAIVMAGMFFAFVIENASHRLAQRFWARTQYNSEVVGVAVLEAGIIFHSLRKSSLVNHLSHPILTSSVSDRRYFGGCRGQLLRNSFCCHPLPPDV